MTVHVLLLVENNSFPFDVRVRREAYALRDAGCRVTVISPRAPGQRWSEAVEGVAVRRFPASPGGSGLLSYAFEFVYSTLAMLALALWVRLFGKVDVVHAANPPDTLFVVGAVMKLLGARFVFDHHDLSPETYLSRFGKADRNAVSKALALLERATFATADIVISTNESYRRLAIQRGRKSPEKVFVVRNGPPLSFQPVEPDPELRRRAAHLIGYIGTMGPQDGVDYLLRVVDRMVNTLGRRDFLAVIVGGGDEAESLRALAASLKIEAYVDFTGRVPDARVRTLLSSVDVCVQPDPLNPLNDKSTMNKMMEYMALGKPVVAFDLVETRFSGGNAAVFIPPNDELEFARQISALFDDPARCRRLGEEGRAAVATRLAWEYSVPQLVAAYRDGLGLPLTAPQAAVDATGQRAERVSERKQDHARQKPLGRPGAITIVAAVNNHSILRANLLRSPLLEAGHRHQFLIREGFRAASQAYNHALDEAENEIVVFVHQDVYLPDHWLSDLERTIESLESQGKPWGVIGCFGMRAGVHGGLGSVYSTGWGVQGNPVSQPEKVETLDEIVLVVRKSSGLRFDDTLPHFHMYGVDLCLTSRSKGLDSYVMPTFCVHNTSQLLKLPPEFFNCYRHIKRKWPQYLPIHSSCITISRFDRHVLRRRAEDVVSWLKGRTFQGAGRLDDPRTALPLASGRGFPEGQS